jgi:hypothetical protein
MSSSAQRPNEAAFAHAHDAFVRHSDYQFNFPAFQRQKPPEWLVALMQYLRHNWPIIKWAIWITAIALILWASYMLFRKFGHRIAELLKQRRTPLVQSTPQQWQPTSAVARELLREADALAAAGQHGKAVHLLLLRSIQDIEKRRPNLVRPNFTSREIGRLQTLPEPARNTFVGIAFVVERALFAGEPVGAGEFARCREAYEHFAFPDLWTSFA